MLKQEGAFEGMPGASSMKQKRGPLEGQKSLKGEAQEILDPLLLNLTAPLPPLVLVHLQPRVRIICLPLLG